MYNLNHVIVIIFNCTSAYARSYTLIYIYIYILKAKTQKKKIQLDFNWILNFVQRVPSNF